MKIYRQIILVQRQSPRYTQQKIFRLIAVMKRCRRPLPPPENLHIFERLSGIGELSNTLNFEAFFGETAPIETMFY